MRIRHKLGEREIIRILTRAYGAKRLPLNYDDDVSVVPTGRGLWLVLKSDMLVASTDVPPGMTLEQAARKAVVATVSDFAAKGVRPEALMVSLGLPSSLGRPKIQEIANGLSEGSHEYHCIIIGGDTNQSDDLVIDCVGAAEVDKWGLITRTGAKPGDRVVVTGRFGNAPAGLRILLARKTPKSEDERTLVEAVLNPVARLDEGLAMSQTGAITSCIDSSDGLAWSLNEIARLSRVRIIVDRIPITLEAERFAKAYRIRPHELALYGGEEYELVATVKRELLGKVKRKVQSLIEIGRVIEGPAGVKAQVGGKIITVQARGWEHFGN